MNAEHAVLVVDDDPDARESLSRLILRAGFTCHVAEDAAQALGILAREKVDVMIADHDMPGMDGAELLAKVAVRFPLASRILLTARQDAEVPQRALNQGQAYRFLNKPCRASELMTAIHFAVEASDQHATMERLAHELRAAEAMLVELRKRHPALMTEIEHRMSRAS